MIVEISAMRETKAMPAAGLPGTSLHRFTIRVLFALICCVAASRPQVPNELPEPMYDVASVRPFDFKGQAFQRSIFDPPHAATFRATAVTVKVLLHFAYGMSDNRILGVPTWANSDLYSVEAKAGERVGELLRKMNEPDAVQMKRRMLQQLLADRFRLEVHKTTRPGMVYVLIPAKGDLKVKPDALDGQMESSQEATKPSMHISGQSISFEHMSFADIAQVLSELTQQTIVDQTRSSGSYSFNVTYRRPSGPSHPEDGDSSPFLSVEDGLGEVGLKIETRKGEVTDLVIDHVEKPSMN